jgi:hypothetical protein
VADELGKDVPSSKGGRKEWDLGFVRRGITWLIPNEMVSHREEWLTGSPVRVVYKD